MIRTTFHVDGRRYALAQGQDVGAVKMALRDAARSGGDFVETIVVGNERVSVLVTPGVPVVFEEHEIPDDDCDNSDRDWPFPSDLDFDF